MPWRQFIRTKISILNCNATLPPDNNVELLINKTFIRIPQQFAKKVPAETFANCGTLLLPILSLLCLFLQSASLALHPIFSFTPLISHSHFFPTYIYHKFSKDIQQHPWALLSFNSKIQLKPAATLSLSTNQKLHTVSLEPHLTTVFLKTGISHQHLNVRWIYIKKCKNLVSPGN